MATSEVPRTLSGIPDALVRLPVVGLIPQELRPLVLSSFQVSSYGFGDPIIREGDEPDGFYVMLSGKARVVTTGAAGNEIPLNTLVEGDAFGESALFDNAPRSATVRASGAVEVARLDAGVFNALVSLHPEIAGAFRQQGRARRLETFLRVHSAFSRLPRTGIAELLEGLEEVAVADGEVAVTEGDVAESMYLVEDGRLRVFQATGDGGTRDLRFLRTGDFFGEVALALRERRTATAVAVGDATLLKLGREAFDGLRERYPEFRTAIEERIAFYERGAQSAVPLDFADRVEAGTQAAPADGAPAPRDRAADMARGVELDALSAAARDMDDARPEKQARKFPLVRQLDEMDCGAASLAMICRYYGRDVSLSYIRAAVGTGLDGTSLSGIQRGGEVIGLSTRAVRASRDRLDELPLPAIVHVGGNHWVVVHEVDGDTVKIADPGLGMRREAREDFLDEWSGFAALATPTPALADAPVATTSVRWLWPHIAPHRKVLLLSLGLAFAGAGMQMLFPVLSQKIIDNVLTTKDYGLLYTLVGGMVVLLIISIVLGSLQRWMMSRTALAIDGSALDHLAGKLLRLPMSYFQTRRSADIERRLEGMRQIRALVVEEGIAGITAVTQLVAAVVIMFVYQWEMAVGWLCTVPIYVGLMQLSAAKLRPTFEGLEEAYSRYSSRQIDAIKGIETVKAMGAERELRAQMTRDFGSLAKKIFASDFTILMYDGVVAFATFMISTAFLFAGALLVMDGTLTLGELVLFNSMVLLANGPIVSLLSLWDEVQMSTVLLGRLQDIFENEPEQGEDHSHLRAVPTLEGRITLRGAGFHYANNPNARILSDLSLDIPPGTTVALVGRSGSGKSTLVKLLAGLMEVTEGTIAYDGVDMRELRHEDLRRRIGFVLQHSYIFDGTIAENIAFGEEEPDFNKVRRAAEIANVEEFVARLPLGYETQIGESGLALSGGQAQRVAIARAVYREPPVLLFDEATSALDTESERMVKENIDRLLEGRTAFIVAHRLSTIRDADLIVVLEQGRIAEAGTHEELLRREGLYAHLHAQQLGG